MVMVDHTLTYIQNNQIYGDVLDSRLHLAHFHLDKIKHCSWYNNLLLRQFNNGAYHTSVERIDNREYR